MNTIVVWILVASSWGSSNYGTTTVVGHFKTEVMCQHVLKNLPVQGSIQARCIQAEIVK